MAIAFFCTLGLLSMAFPTLSHIDRLPNGEVYAMPQDICPFSAFLSKFPEPTRLMEAAIRFKVQDPMSLGFHRLYRINAF